MKIKLKYINNILFHPTLWIVLSLLSLTISADEAAQRSSAAVADMINAAAPTTQEEDAQTGKLMKDKVIDSVGDLAIASDVTVQASFEEPIPSAQDVVAADAYLSKPGSSYPFTDILSHNSGISNDLSSQDVVINMVDTATIELQQRAEHSSQQHNTHVSSPPPPLVAANITQPPPVPAAAPVEYAAAAAAEAAAPVAATEQSLDGTINTSLHQGLTNKSEDDVIVAAAPPAAADSTDKILNQVPKIEPKQNLTEEIPSFSEWTQIQMEESKLREANTTTTNTAAAAAKMRVRNKNYASPDCGAKIVAANAESVSAHSVLTPSRDEYKLNTCTTPKIWFIVELCEAIQAKKIEMANFELFSSSPKDFSVSVSDRFPTRDWSNVVGQFTAEDERVVQSFDLHPHLFGKYIKVELHTHYGSEHFCPISIFRVYGTSEFEVLEKEDQPHANHSDDDEDDAALDHAVDGGGGASGKDGAGAQNLFNSAKDAVISIVKKAAEVLGNNNKGNASNSSSGGGGSSTASVVQQIKQPIYSPLITTCTTPSHLVVCTNCSDLLFGRVYELLSCRSKQLGNLLHIEAIRRAIYRTELCERYGFNFSSLLLKEEKEEEDEEKTTTTTLQQEQQPKAATSSYVNSFFPPRYLAALCNTVAIIENKVVHNVSLKQQVSVSPNENITSIFPNETTQEEINLEATELDIIIIINDTNDPQDLLEPSNHVNTIANDDDVDVSNITHLIRPTKTLTQYQAIEELGAANEDSQIIDGDEQLININTMTTTATPHQATEIHHNQQLLKEELEDDKSIIITQPSISDSSELLQQEQQIIDNAAAAASGEASSSSSAASNEEEATIIPAAAAAAGGDALDLDNIINDLAHAATTEPPQQPPQIVKESVFLRLSNRIKALERNMSLSGQYLEELSRRYKKQVEEMQRLLEKTIVTLNEESQRKDQVNARLEDRLNQLSDLIEGLIADRSTRQDYLSPIFFTLVLVTFLVVVKLLRRTPKVLTLTHATTKTATTTTNEQLQQPPRRKSIDVINHATPAKKERRPSEEVLKIGTYQHLLVEEVHAEGQQHARIKQKRKKKKNIIRISEDSQMSSHQQWNNRRQELNGHTHHLHHEIEDIPFVLEECDNNPLQDMPLPKPLQDDSTPAVAGAAAATAPPAAAAIVDIMKSKIRLPVRKISSPASLKSQNDVARRFRRDPSTGGSQSGGSSAGSAIINVRNNSSGSSRPISTSNLMMKRAAAAASSSSANEHNKQVLSTTNGGQQKRNSSPAPSTDGGGNTSSLLDTDVEETPKTPRDGVAVVNGRINKKDKGRGTFKKIFRKVF